MIFNADKPKKISMVVETSNVDQDRLDFIFNINVDGIKYGFPCELQENKVMVQIPALNDIIKVLKEGDYNVTLEVTGEDKYYLRPFEDTITIKQTPTMNVLVDKDDDSNVHESLDILVSSLIEEKEEEKEEIVQDKPESVLSSVFD